MRRGTFAGAVNFVLIVLLLGALSFAVAQRRGGDTKRVEDMTPQEKQARVDSLIRERERINQEKGRETQANRPTGAALTTIITRYEGLLERCANQKSDRCADVMFTLGALYYDQARDEFALAHERYAAAFEAFERTGRGTPPTPPQPDYSKSLRMYWQLTREYPRFSRLPEVFTQMGTNYLVSGHIDTAKIIWQQLVERFPNSPRVSGAHFRLSDLAFMENNFRQAYEHLSKIKRNEIDPTSWEMTHYRKGECMYNIGDFDKAVEYFHTYVVECDAGRYQRRQFRDMALEYMAISFSDMPNGVQEAINFFRRHPNKPYEAQVIYAVGAKNREHGQWDAAILALEGALERFPLYKDAPLARQMLIESYVVKREAQKANAQRETLVDEYGPGSRWYQANSNERRVIDIARASQRRALGDIALFHHGEAQRTRDRAAYDRAMKRYNEFFQRFPEDKWRVFEYRYNVAEIYSALGDCEKAAEHYNFVAMEDLSVYPAFVAELDTLGVDPEQLEQLRARQGDRSNPIAISQEDAGFNTIVALDNCRKRDMAREEMDEERAYTLPSTRRLVEYIMTFQRRFPQSANAGEVLYLAGNIHYGGKAWNEAINAFKQIVDQYPDAKIAGSAARMLGNSYSQNGQMDLAMQTFKALLARTPAGQERDEIMDLAAGAMYRHAESIKKAGNLTGAADAFRAIANEFPESRVAVRGWFEAGVCFEEMNDFVQAAQNFEMLTQRFPRAEEREAAFIRAAENYKKADMWERAAQTYLAAANQIPKAEFAIPSLSAASEAYQKLGQYDMAGKMFELIFERYANDPKTPQALYNAGLIFEKGRHYHDAIKVYELLARNYPNSEFAGEAFFSIGLCWEKLGEFARMANAFSDYAQRFTNDRFKQVQALVKAGDAYFNMENFRESEASYNQAIRIFEQHARTSDIDVANVAQAFYRLGEISYKRFEAIKLEARNEREMQTRMRDKTTALGEPAKFFARAIELGVEEWTMRATYMIGRGFYDMAEAVANQTLFGNQDQRMAGRIQVLSSLDRYYDRAMEYFGQNIAWAKEQNLSGEYIAMSMQAMMEMAFKKGHILEEVGLLFKNAPIPDILTEDEREYYALELEERYLRALDAAMPVYENAMKLAQEIGVAESPWIDRIRERLTAINAESEYINIELVAWVPTERPREFDEHGNEIIARPRDSEYERSVRRIQNILSMDIAVEEKISQLNRVRMEAERNIVLERERIRELKEKAGS
ncbi:MAG: tetratricopeptide repeat protein [Chitinispirillales bacterium]|jgi:tetratricopeptide (TPR) repeat protein|nr:tetratricopeptide repeat protein [Chitinispirillales bacterium]